MPVSSAVCGRTPDDRPVVAHRLVGEAGLTLEVLELGAVVRTLEVPDRDGRPVNVVLGYADLADYSRQTAYFGAVVGRYANRLAGGRFTLGGETHTVPANEGENALHGGPDGYDRRLWRTAEVGEDHVTLALTSPAGDQGFPGRLEIAVTYRLVGLEVTIDYEASTDAPTVVNLTNHSYFALDVEGTIDRHELVVEADAVVVVGPDQIPTGELADVTGTPFDLRRPTVVGERVRVPDPQLLLAQGVDHHFVVGGEGLRRFARLTSPASGIALEVWSDQPGVQVYTGNFLDGTIVGTGGRTYRQGAGIAMETQQAPDTPNRPAFGSAVLEPGEAYRSTTSWRFGTTSDTTGAD